MTTNRALRCATFLQLLSTCVCGASAAGSELANSPTWLKLIHYEDGGLADAVLASAIESDSFFLAEDGRTNPDAELQATLSALSQPLDGDPDDHAQCRFPARYIWLKQQSLLDGVSDISCPRFEDWIFGAATESLSIVFVTGYLGNPASYYGHTLLKFNSSSDRGTSDLLDVTVNYGAVIPPDVGSIEYIYRGATGGFPAGFSHIEYYYHDHNYGELELRDLWEYELNLTAEEVGFVVAHAWEVLGREFVYYFFRRNCAYRMAEIIEIVDGIEIVPPRRLWTVPQELIRRGAESQHHGKPLLGELKHYPSRQSIFYAKYRRLDEKERRTLRDIAENSGHRLIDSLLIDLPPASQPRVVDALIDYYQYRMPRDEPQDSATSRRYRNLLAHRFRLPPAKQVPPESPVRGPDDDRAPGYMSIGFGHNNSSGNTALLRLRPAYYDALDASVSHVPHSELSMGEILLSAGDGGVSLRQVSLFRVEAVNGAVSGLPGDNGRSWVLGLGLVEQNLGCTDCLVGRFEGDIGRSFPLGSSSVAGMYVGGALQDARNGQGNLFARVSAFVNLRAGSRFRLRARYESRYHMDGRLRFEDVASLEGRMELSRNWDARLRLQKNVSTEASVSVGYYW